MQVFSDTFSPVLSLHVKLVIIAVILAEEMSNTFVGTKIRQMGIMGLSRC